MAAVKDHNGSWYRFGEALVVYKAFYAEARGCMKAAQIIGQAIHRDERTVRKVLASFELAVQASAAAIGDVIDWLNEWVNDRGVIGGFADSTLASFITLLEFNDGLEVLPEQYKLAGRHY